jgi:hypothetical protein
MNGTMSISGGFGRLRRHLAKTRTNKGILPMEPAGIEPATSCLQSRGGHAGASRYGGFGSAEMAL